MLGSLKSQKDIPVFDYDKPTSTRSRQPRVNNKDDQLLIVLSRNRLIMPVTALTWQGFLTVLKARQETRTTVLLLRQKSQRGSRR